MYRDRQSGISLPRLKDRSDTVHMAQTRTEMSARARGECTLPLTQTHPSRVCESRRLPSTSVVPRAKVFSYVHAKSRMVNTLPEHPGPPSEYLELHAVPSTAHLPTDGGEHSMTSRHIHPEMDDTSDTTPLQGEDSTYSKGMYGREGSLGALCVPCSDSYNRV